jgi:hypothetical protein
MSVMRRPRPGLDLGSGLKDENAPSLVIPTIGFLMTTALMSTVMMLFSLL